MNTLPLHDQSRSENGWYADTWFNSKGLRLKDLHGQVVVLHAFQMLCPGCVSDGVPLMRNIQSTFSDSPVICIGLHTVFEHHEAMNPNALEAFLHEYKITYPVAVDMPSPDGPQPQTMRSYKMRGTPSLLLFDTEGQLRLHQFGAVNPMALGAEIAQLLPVAKSTQIRSGESANTGCDSHGCSV